MIEDMPPLLSCREYVEMIAEFDTYCQMYEAIGNNVADAYESDTGKRVQPEIVDAVNFAINSARHATMLAFQMLFVALWVQQNRPRQ